MPVFFRRSPSAYATVIKPGRPSNGVSPHPAQGPQHRPWAGRGMENVMYLYMTTGIKSFRTRDVFWRLTYVPPHMTIKKHRINGLEPSAVFFQGQVHDCQRRDCCKDPHF